MAQVLPSIQVTDNHDVKPRDVTPKGLQRQDTGRLSARDGPGTGSVTGKVASILRSPSSSSTAPMNDAREQSSANTAYTEGTSPEAAIDPLSQQILHRTNTSIHVQTLRTQGDPSSPQSPTFSSELNDAKQGAESLRESTTSTYVKQDKKKGVSFLSRFIPNKKKASTLDGFADDVSENGDAPRPEGMDAPAFRHTVDNMGFNPKYPQPPAYIKVRTKYKKEKQFDRMFLAQELRSATDKKSPPVVGANPAPQSGSAASHNPIWATEFSKDGRFLAAGGQDRIVRVWAVISSPDERRTHEKDESDPGYDDGSRLSAPVFQQKPVREYHGHTSTILDLSWSKNNFLLSSSMDKTVRLWHISRNENLCTFKHTDFVPSIQFHPKDDRFFLAGSLDTKLRLWSIPDKSVAFWNQLPDMITAVSFTPDGKTCIAGTLSGLCMFYETEGLKFQTQMHVKSTRGANAKGSKITGIQATHWPPGNDRGEIKLLISSNDSRIRLYNFRDKSLEMKFRGHENNCSQIRASFADDTGFIICGSEDRKAYIWSTSAPEGEKRNQRPMEMFEAHNSITTCAVMAPLKTRQLLGASEDPIYDLCNPPPVTLVSKAESVSSSRPARSEAGTNSAQAETSPKKVAESPAYLARSAHTDGNIIVTADYTGAIKVFRQDCAYSKRLRVADNWDASSVFSKRTGPKYGRPSSIMSKASRATRRRDSTSTQPPDDRIMSWRQDISHGSFDSVNTGGNNIQAPRRSMARSVSPRKHRTSISSPSLAPTRTNESFPASAVSAPSARGSKLDSPKTSKTSLGSSVDATRPPTASDGPGPTIVLPQRSITTTFDPDDTTSTSIECSAPRRAKTDLRPTSAHNNPPPTLNATGQAWSFFSRETWKDQLSRSHLPPRHASIGDQNIPLNSNNLSVPTTPGAGSRNGSVDRNGSVGLSSVSSKLTSEALAMESEDEMKCERCTGTEFKVRVVKWQGREERRLVCKGCGGVVD